MLSSKVNFWRGLNTIDYEVFIHKTFYSDKTGAVAIPGVKFI